MFMPYQLSRLLTEAIFICPLDHHTSIFTCLRATFTCPEQSDRSAFFLPWGSVLESPGNFWAQKAVNDINFIGQWVFKGRAVYTPETSCTEWNLCLFKIVWIKEL